jgi:hypothetical protein
MKNNAFRGLLLAASICIFMLPATFAQAPQFFNDFGGTAYNAYPLNSTTNNRLQSIYAPGELNSSGPTGTPAGSGFITKIYFKTGTTISASAVYTNFTIGLSQNAGTTSAFVTGPYYATTTVFYQPSFSLTGVAATSWYGITLQTPFFYDPSLSLVVEIQVSTGTGNQIANTSTTSPNNRRLYSLFSSSTGTANTGWLNFGMDVQPPMVPTDAGLQAFVFPADTVCSGNRTISVILKNHGPNDLYNTKIGCRINNDSIPTINWVGSLAANATTNVTLGTYNFQVGTNYNIKAFTSEPNMMADTNKVNDTIIKNNVFVHPLPTASLTPVSPPDICDGDSLLLTAASNAANPSYIWKNGGVNITGALAASFAASLAGTYTVEVMDGTTSCSSLSNAVSLALKPKPTITSLTFSPKTICAGSATNSSTLTALSFIPPANTQVGTQTTTISGNNGNPYRSGNGANNQIRTQMIYTVAELQAAGFTAGPINSLGFTTTAAAGTVINFEIKIGHTTVSVATTTFETTPMTTVFTQASFTPALGLNTHVFNQGSFIWDGVSNIMVNVCQTNSVTGTTTVAAYTPVTLTNLSMQTSTTSCSSATGTTVVNKPIITFGRTSVDNTASYTWTWMPGNLTGNVQTVTPASTTIYTVTALGANGCTSKASDTVIVIPSVATATPTGPTTFCQGDSVVINANTGAGLTYQWKKDGVDIQGATGSSYSANASGDYTVLVNSISVPCPATSLPVTVTVHPVPVAYAGNDTTVCLGGTAVLTATGGVNYTWSTGAHTQTINVNPLINSTYKVTVSNGFCEGFDSVMVLVNKVIFSLGNDTVVSTPSVTINAGPGFVSYLWSNGSTTQAAVIDTTGVGIGIATVWCQVSDPLGCTARDTMLVNFGPLAVAQINQESGVKIYPNPSSNLFNVALSGFTGSTVRTCITNLQGQLIFCEDWKTDHGACQNQIDLGVMPHGVYVIRFISDRQTDTRRIVVE